MDNYIKAFKQYQARLDDPTLSPEETEGIILERERVKQELEVYKTVERIVEQRTATDGLNVEYFCKWNGLPYDHCTWELEKEVNDLAKEQIEQFTEREREALGLK